MVPSLPVLFCESSVSVKESPDKEKNVLVGEWVGYGGAGKRTG